MNNVSKPETKLSQWDALMLESLKNYGWSNEELLRRVLESDLPKDDSKFQFDYAALTAFAKEQTGTLAQAVSYGYQIKYNTIRGIYSWIAVALKREAELILDPGSEAVIVPLSEDEANLLNSVLSYGWTLHVLDQQPGNDGLTLYRVEPLSQSSL